jgi:methylenetetrahydrofolate dehydrogenase (NADP+) / methenyltetrahydrofolate cyclohydrolase
MPAKVINGTEVGQAVRAEVKAEVEAWVAAGNRRPGLATVLVGEDPASAVYVASKRKACAEVGIADLHQHLDADISQDALAALITELGENPEVSGILLQLPVPKPLSGQALTALIPPLKDVDGLTPYSTGLLGQGAPGLRPCTPEGVMELLDRNDVEIEGAEAVIVGRSDLVGKPVAQLLLQRNATVTICHSRTRDLPGVCRRADILIAAVGRPRLVGAEFVKPGAVVIDVGINRTDDGLVGDVDFDPVAEKASLITPVPRGVGPMTIAMLLKNTLRAAELQRDSEQSA